LLRRLFRGAALPRVWLVIFKQGFSGVSHGLLGFDQKHRQEVVLRRLGFLVCFYFVFGTHTFWFAFARVIHGLEKGLRALTRRPLCRGLLLLLEACGSLLGFGRLTRPLRLLFVRQGLFGIQVGGLVVLGN